MWKIIKSELLYQANYLFYIFFSSLLVFSLLSFNWLFTARVKNKINIGNLFFIYMLVCIATILITSTWSREHRNRRILILPLSLRSIALARISVQIFFWIFLLGLFFIYSLLSPYFSLPKKTLALLTGQTGVVLIFIALIFFWRDMVLPIKNSTGNIMIEKTVCRLLNALILLLFNLLAMTQLILVVYCTIDRENLLTWIWLNNTVAWSLLLLGAVLIVLSVFVFEKKRSYLITILLATFFLSVWTGCHPVQKRSLENKVQMSETDLVRNTDLTPWKMRSIPDQMDYHNVTGLSLAVIEDNRIMWARGYGLPKSGSIQPVTTRTLFRAMGVSSQVSRFLALRLVENGLFDLFEDVNPKLKSWKIPENPWTDNQPLTLYALLKYNLAGLNEFRMQSYKKNSGIPDLIDILKGRVPALNPPVKVIRRPGKYHPSDNLYSVSYLILEQLIQDVIRKPFHRIAEERLFSPLNMKSSTYNQDIPEKLARHVSWGYTDDQKEMVPFENIYPARAAIGLWTTPSDLARFLIEMMKSTRGDPQCLVSRHTMKRIIDIEKSHFRFYSNEGGFHCVFAYNPTRGQGAVIMMNQSGNNTLTREILHGISTAWSWRWGKFQMTDTIIQKWLLCLTLVIFVSILILASILFVLNLKRKIS